MKKEGNRLINLSFIEKKFQTFTYRLCIYTLHVFEGNLFEFYATTIDTENEN